MNYQFEWGLVKSLEGLDRRSSFPSQMVDSIEVFRQFEAEFKAEFQHFIADAQEMVRNRF